MPIQPDALIRFRPRPLDLPGSRHTSRWSEPRGVAIPGGTVPTYDQIQCAGRRAGIPWSKRRDGVDDHGAMHYVTPSNDERVALEALLAHLMAQALDRDQVGWSRPRSCKTFHSRYR